MFSFFTLIGEDKGCNAVLKLQKCVAVYETPAAFHRHGAKKDNHKTFWVSSLNSMHVVAVMATKIMPHSLSPLLFLHCMFLANICHIYYLTQFKSACMAAAQPHVGRCF